MQTDTFDKKRMQLFLIISVFFNMAASFAHAVTPTVFNSLGLGQYMFGVALASMQIVSFLFSPFWGRLNDFFSSRYCLLICSLGYAFGQFCFSQSVTELDFIIARAFTGLFTAGAWVSLLTYIINTVQDPRERGSYLTISATIQTVGGAFGYFVGGLLGEISVNVTFFAQVTVLAACGVAFFFICKNDVKPKREIHPMTILKQSNPFATFLASREFMTTVLATFFLMTALQSLGTTAFDQSANYYMRDQLGLSSGYNGVVKGATGIVTLLFNSIVTIWIIRHADLSKSMTLLFGVSSCVMSLTVLTPNPWIFIGSNVAFYVLGAALPPLLQNLIASNSSGDNSNLVMGFYNSVKSLGGIVGALLSGLLYAVGPKLPFVFGLLAYLIALACMLWYISHSGKKTPNQAKQA